MKKFKKIPLIGNLLKKIAPKIGASVLLEPTWGYAGQITFKNGRRSYFRYTSLDLNTIGSSEIAKDKDYTNFFLGNMGYPTIEGKAFYSDKWCKAINSKNNIDKGYIYANKLGFPVILKPNSKSQGVGVAKVHNRVEFFKVAKHIFKVDNILLVQKFEVGRDYRVVVLGDKVISAYERTPLVVIGDGRSSIKKLISLKQKAFISSGRDTVINLKDFRIGDTLKRNKITFAHVLKKGEKLKLLDNANLSTGGDAYDVTPIMHSSFKSLAIKITKDMGLKLCGVDLMVKQDIKLPLSIKNQCKIIEINSAPGLDNYYATGKKQQKIVEDLYLEILKEISK